MTRVSSWTLRLAAAAAVAVAAGGAHAADVTAPAAPSGGTTRLEGTAMRDRRSPVIGATASLTIEGAPSPLLLTATDEKGSFRFDGLQDGAYHLELHRDDLTPVVKPGVSVRFPYRAVLELTMLPALETAPADPQVKKGGPAPAGAATVRGVVLTRDERPVPETRVRLVRSDGALDPRSVLSGADGAFAFTGLPEGRYRLEILGAGYLPLRLDLDLRQDLDVRAQLAGQPAEYVPPPTDLLPTETPIPPPGW